MLISWRLSILRRSIHLISCASSPRWFTHCTKRSLQRSIHRRIITAWSEIRGFIFMRLVKKTFPLRFTGEDSRVCTLSTETVIISPIFLCFCRWHRTCFCCVMLLDWWTSKFGIEEIIGGQGNYCYFFSGVNNSFFAEWTTDEFFEGVFWPPVAYELIFWGETVISLRFSCILGTSSAFW